MKYADKGWVSWPDWLGYGEGLPEITHRRLLGVREARAFVREAGAGELRAVGGVVQRRTPP